MDRAYDEFGLFHENASEYGLPFQAPPIVRRERVVLPGSDGPQRTVSCLVWGTGEPELVFIHGGAQNAHTWDTVLLALGVSALAIDLPGHGHSDWRDDGAYTPVNLADDVAHVVRALAPHARAVVGMSLGGMTSMQLAVRHPELVLQLILVDITPGVNGTKAKAVLDFINGPQSFAGFDDLLQRTIEHNPTRAESSLRRGILHNAHPVADGSWEWNYDRRGHARSRDVDADAVAGSATPDTRPTDQLPTLSPQWDDFAEIMAPMALIRGGTSPVVDDDDVAEAKRRQPTIRVDVVEGAGHSIQGDRPLELAALIREIVFSR